MEYFGIRGSAVIFNWGFVEPKGSASICQEFRGWSVKKFFKNNLACKITSDQATELQLSTKYLVRNQRF